MVRNYTSKVIVTDDQYKVRFLRQVEKAGECLVWKGSLHPRRNKVLGRMRYRGNNWLVHRLSAKLFLDNHITMDNIVTRKCKNPLCVNPDHLIIEEKRGTCKQDFDFNSIPPCTSLEDARERYKKLSDVFPISVHL